MIKQNGNAYKDLLCLYLCRMQEFSLKGENMPKMPFNHNISLDVARIFEDLFETLGGPRYQILEAAIQAFAVLPLDIQLRLKAAGSEERQRCFDLLRTLSIAPPKAQEPSPTKSRTRHPKNLQNAGNRI